MIRANISAGAYFVDKIGFDMMLYLELVALVVIITLGNFDAIALLFPSLPLLYSVNHPGVPV